MRRCRTARTPAAGPRPECCMRDYRRKVCCPWESPFQFPEDHVELLPIVNHSSEGAASMHRFVNISELTDNAQRTLEESVVFGQAPTNPSNPRAKPIVSMQFSCPRKPRIA